MNVEERVKNEIHCRVEPGVMQYLLKQRRIHNCTLSDACRSLIAKGMRFDEDLATTKARILMQHSPSLKMLNILNDALDGFVYEYESNCTGEEQRYSWGFGLDASDEYFETTEACLTSFLKYLNTLAFSYKTLPQPECLGQPDPIVLSHEIEDEMVDW